MNELIYKQDAIDALTTEANTEGAYGYVDVKTIVDCLTSMPSAEPEIIHCKNCKYLQKWRSEESAKKFGQIYECGKGVFDCPKTEDFCSHAERRTDG